VFRGVRAVVWVSRWCSVTDGGSNVSPAGRRNEQAGKQAILILCTLYAQFRIVFLLRYYRVPLYGHTSRRGS
jgi:hypothetical protein